MSQAFPIDPPVPLNPNTAKGSTILGQATDHWKYYVFYGQTTSFDDANGSEDEKGEDKLEEEVEDEEEEVEDEKGVFHTPVTRVSLLSCLLIFLFH